MQANQHVLWPVKIPLFLKVCIFCPLDLHPFLSTSTLWPFLRLSLPPPFFALPIPFNHGVFSSIQANQMTQRWRTLCKTLTIKEGNTTTNTSTTTIMAMSLMMQTGKLRAKTARTPRHICGHPWRVGHSRIRVQTPVYRRAEVWSLTCRPPSVPPGPRVPGADLTRTTIMR